MNADRTGTTPAADLLPWVEPRVERFESLDRIRPEEAASPKDGSGTPRNTC